MRPVVGLVLLAGVAAASVQKPFSTSSFEAEENEYQFKWPVEKVAIIGAGPSGLIAYRELTEAGLDVRIFERDSVPGGNWHYTDEVPLDAPVPNAPCPIADFVPSVLPASVDLPHSEEFEDDGNIWRDHRGPKPIWESLTCNAPSFSQWPWPVGTQWVRNYVRSYASYININSNDDNPAAAYNTRVERVEKRINEPGQEQGWRLWLRTLEPAQGNTYRATWWTEDFDAVVVAVGRYNAPSMPSIPGLEQWVQRFPDLVRHSRQYRRAEAYANQTVLITVTDNATHEPLENQRRRILKNTTLVGEIERFLPISEGSPIQSGHVELKNGTIISGIDSVTLATGFRYSFPFLPQYYDGATYEPHAGSATIVSPFLPSDGLYIRDLYLDQFYLRDPTLAFLGFPLGISPIVSTEYTALAVAKVWTNKAKLPDTQTMRALYEKTVAERGGYGKYVMFWGPERSSAIFAYIIGWLNEAAAKYGGKQVNGLPINSDEIIHYWEIARYGGPLRGRNGADQGRNDVLFYDDTW
ncbi:FAD/NAD(P)-binding domain-containing protein [Imleria badia]|nr:FAD/NAD(P)-binding domain-containing protein [Imleria badia]